MSEQNPALQNAAALARLQPDGNEIARLEHDLEAILRMVEQLRAADTSGVEPLYHPLELAAPLREDLVTEQDDQSAARLALAPRAAQGHYLVPRFLD